ncbi:MAG TPA: FHA domain-containing protein [bacterium]|nr:FHA domain-containing protein [Myxococcales bacterium]OQA61828.1 MAG: Glycogen accumulation regulator GarA [bacterium ADurb.Bin270]HPW45335.1 FHA domain-containing protein [bacterium]HQC50430.1 FHA domain-containing protein [bacterium]
MTAEKPIELEFPINHALVEAATHAMEEWRVIKDRLRRIEEHKGQVTEKVYERVRKDYEERLASSTDSLLEKKEEIDKELSILESTRSKINGQLAEHKHKLEEVNFRNTLGEFAENEFREASKAEQEKIRKFETVLAAVESNISRYQSIFEDDDGLFVKQEESHPEEEISEFSEDPMISAIREADTTSPSTELDRETDAVNLLLSEEPQDDYFSAESSEPESREPDQTEESSTIKAPIEEIIGGRSPHPRILVISGEMSGTAYPLKGIVSFGRAESNTVTLRDSKCSRQHAQIQQHGNEFVVEDLNSSNGTFVNGERVSEHVLSNGDEIQIGDTLMQFQING